MVGKTGSCSGGQDLSQESFNPVICWWMGLSCLVWGKPALGSVGSMVGLTVNLKRVYTKGGLPGLLLPGPRSLWWTPANHTSTREPPTLAGSFDSVSCGGSASFLWALVCTRFCLCPPRLDSLFPPVLWKSYNQIPLTCKGRFPRDSQSLCGIPSLGSLMWGLELHNSGRTSLVLLFSSRWVTHPADLGFDFIIIVPLLPSHCSCFFVFGCGVSFLGEF